MESYFASEKHNLNGIMSKRFYAGKNMKQESYGWIFFHLPLLSFRSHSTLFPKRVSRTKFFS
jgi:hypothetical protein